MEINDLIETAIKERLEMIEVKIRKTPAGQNMLDRFGELEEMFTSMDKLQEWEKLWQACLEWEYCFCRQAYIQGIKDHDDLLKHEIFDRESKEETE